MLHLYLILLFFITTFLLHLILIFCCINIVLQSMKAKEREALTPIALRKRAAEYAGEAINTQREVR